MLTNILLWVGLFALFLGGIYINPRWQERKDG
jgi:hypothetical protein